MSDFRAIATVTATLRDVLQAAVQADVAGATVTTARPSDQAGGGLPTRGINLFLYQVSHRGHRANDELPTRRAEGSPMQRPRAPVELHYLLSCYGDDATLEPQRLLGSAVAFLNAQPQLTRAQIEAVVTNPANAFLAGSDLGAELDVVRFSPMNLTVDELSRLWSVFLQTPYVLSTTFKAATVLLERPIRTTEALPVREVRLAALPLRRPEITSISPLAGGEAITQGATLVLEGSDLAGDVTEVQVDGVPVAAGPAQAGRIEVVLPATLTAGPHAVMVRLGIRMAAAGEPRLAFASRLATFLLQPVITGDIKVDRVQGAGAALRSADIKVTVDPEVEPRQTATLELLDKDAVVLTAPAAARSSASRELAFAVSGLVAGPYLARVRVDGAASPLSLGADQRPIGPEVRLA